MNIIGIDLAGKPENPTGICILQNNGAALSIVFSDDDILRIVGEYKPEVIALDAPIMQGNPRIRKADRELKKYGAMPPTLPSMQSLTFRGSNLANNLLKHYRVIEVFPTATAKILGVYNQEYQKTAETLNIVVENKHELDAFLCCLTGQLYLQDKTIEVGDKTGTIVVPKNQ